MSLALTALRLQAVAVLLADPVLGPLLDGRVYDSRIADFDHAEPVPTLIVTTEELTGEAYSANNGGPPFRDACDLVCEIAMTAVQDVAGVAMLGHAATDRELEAQIDLIVWRAEEALCAGETPQARLLRERVTRRVTKRKASRFSTDETGERLAIRLLTFTVQVKGDDTGEIGPGPFGVLPEPLRSVAAAATGSARDTCTLLAAGLAPLRPTEPDPAFHGVDAVLAPQALDPLTPPDRAADLAAGRTLPLTADTLGSP